MHNQKATILGITAGFVAIGLFFFLMWLFLWRFEVSTKDAYVHGNQVVVTPQIEGYIAVVNVQDTELAEEGRVLVELDKTDWELSYTTAKNELAEEVRNVVQMFAHAESLDAIAESRKAELARTNEDYNHRKKLLPLGGVSKEDFQHSEAAFVSAFSNYISALYDAKGANALVENTTLATHPLVLAAIDRVKETYVNLGRCTIRAPATGLIAQKGAQVGESVNRETPLMTIVPLDQIWVNANFKETKLRHVRLGQPATLHSDYFGSEVTFHGKVIGIGAGTGSVFSVLPPQNATGNWIKIVQRLPIRIALDPEQVKDFPLRLGLSMHAKVDIHNKSGKLVPAPPPETLLFKTDIFEKELDGVNEVIAKIIEENGQRKTP